MWVTIFSISIGASFGALLRYQLSQLLNHITPFLPMGTLVANGVGGYVVGAAMAWFLHHPNISFEWRLIWITGFCGGLTTFSTYSLEVIMSLQEGRVASALMIAVGHLLLSLSATALGLWSVALFLRS